MNSKQGRQIPKMLREGLEAWWVGQSWAGGGIARVCTHRVRLGAFVPADWGMEVTWGKSVIGPRPLQSY